MGAVPAPGGETVGYFATTDSGGERRRTIQFRDLATGRLGDAIETSHDNWGAAWRPPDAEQFATTDGEGFVRVWNWRRGELVAESRVADGYVAGLDYSADGERIIVGERSGAVFEVDADSLEPVGDRIELDAVVEKVLATSDASTVLVLLSGKSYAMVDLGNGDVVRTQLGLDPASLAISPDGTKLAVGAATGEVGLADLRTGNWLRPPANSHEGWVQTVAYAPDGRTFVSAGNDGQVELWDGRTGDSLATIAPDAANVWAAAQLMRDGHTVIVATRDGAIFQWDTSIDSWIDFASRHRPQPH